MSLSQVGVYYGVLECSEGCFKGVRWSLEEFERCLEGREGVVTVREGVQLFLSRFSAFYSENHRSLQ